MKRIFLCIVSGLITLAASALDLKVTPGTLRNELPALTSTTDETVRISGEANVTDLILLRELPAGVRTLDLSGLQIVAYTYQQGGYMNRLSYEANEIPPYMLFGTHISKLTLPAGVTRIGDAAFGLTPLDSFTTPATLETLGDYAFSGCTDLKEVEFTRPVILGKGAFRNCRNLIRVRFGYDPLEIPASFFEGCSSLQTGVPASVSIVGELAYRGAGLSEVDLSNVSTVGDYAFADMKVLRNIIIPRSHDVVYGIGAFSNDPELNDLSDWAGNIPDLLLAHSSTSGRNNVFLNTPEIGEGAFANNMSIDSLRLGKDVGLIRAHAFRNVKSLREINTVALNKNVPAADLLSFSGLEGDDGRYDISLLVAPNSSSFWEEHPVWGLFTISEATGLDDLKEDAAGEISISRHNGTIEIIALSPIENVEIFTTSGMTLLSATPGTTRFSADDLPSAEVLVVKVEAGNSVKVTKLR